MLVRCGGGFLVGGPAPSLVGCVDVRGLAGWVFGLWVHGSEGFLFSFGYVGVCWCEVCGQLNRFAISRGPCIWLRAPV